MNVNTDSVSVDEFLSDFGRDDLARDDLTRNGFSLISGLYDSHDVKACTLAVDNLFNDSSSQVSLEPTESNQSIRSQGGNVYAARNLHEIYPDFDSLWMRPKTCQLLTKILGPEFGLVRALYFDKHPDRTWSLPWHRDMTIAVEDNNLPSDEFTKPTQKTGIPHVEAPHWLLKQMVTLRLHLDPVTEENGPLIVKAGDFGEEELNERESSAVTVTCAASDVLVMRPLLLHSSPSSSQGSIAHRRIIHMEFCGQPALPEGFRWRTFQKPVLT